MKQSYGVDIKWLAVTSFEIRYGDTTVVTDPYITECPFADVTWEDVEACDIICLGHSHWDHITDIPRLVKKFRPLVLCGEMTAQPLVEWLDYTPMRMYPMHANLELNFGEVKIMSLYGRHTDLKKNYSDLMAQLHANPLCQADPGIAALQSVGSMEYRNYLFTFPNGTRLLLWGNDVTPVQLDICKALKPDIAIIQRSITPEDVAKKAEFAAAIGCKILIPHHHDFRSKDEPSVIDNFEKEFLARAPESIFLRPEHGQWLHL